MLLSQEKKLNHRCNLPIIKLCIWCAWGTIIFFDRGGLWWIAPDYFELPSIHPATWWKRLLIPKHIPATVDIITGVVFIFASAVLRFQVRSRQKFYPGLNFPKGDQGIIFKGRIPISLPYPFAKIKSLLITPLRHVFSTLRLFWGCLPNKNPQVPRSQDSNRPHLANTGPEGICWFEFSLSCVWGD